MQKVHSPVQDLIIYEFRHTLERILALNEECFANSHFILLHSYWRSRFLHRRPKETKHSNRINFFCRLAHELSSRAQTVNALFLYLVLQTQANQSVSRPESQKPHSHIFLHNKTCCCGKKRAHSEAEHISY